MSYSKNRITKSGKAVVSLGAARSHKSESTWNWPSPDEPAQNLSRMTDPPGLAIFSRRFFRAASTRFDIFVNFVRSGPSMLQSAGTWNEMKVSLCDVDKIKRSGRLGSQLFEAQIHELNEWNIATANKQKQCLHHYNLSGRNGTEPRALSRKLLRSGRSAGTEAERWQTRSLDHRKAVVLFFLNIFHFYIYFGFFFYHGDDG